MYRSIESNAGSGDELCKYHQETFVLVIGQQQAEQKLQIKYLSIYAYKKLTSSWQTPKYHSKWQYWVVGCWRGYLSGARCRLAYGPADATATHCLLLQ